MGPIERSQGRPAIVRDLLLGALLFAIVVLAVLFATGEDTSFIYIDF